MNVIEGFHFIRPWFLLLLIPAVAVLYTLPFLLNKTNSWYRISDSYLIKHLFVKRDVNLKSLKIITSLMLCCFAVALSGPSFYKVRVKAMKNRIPTVLVIDLSASMQVSDVKPTRAAVASAVAKRILNKIKGSEIALVVYSDEPYRIVPITEDTAVISNLLPLLNTKIMPTFGSRPDRALLLAYDMISNSGQKAGHIIMLTDGLGNAADKVNDILKDSYYTDIYVSFVGIGTERGAPIPRFDTGFVKTDDGKMVISTLDRASLEKAARYGKGYYMHQDVSDFEMKRLLDVVSDKIWDSQSEDAEQSADGGYWFMFPLLFILPFFFRRTVMNVILISWFLCPTSAFAGFKDLWFNGNQIGIFYYKRKEYLAAADSFINHHLKAAALVNAGAFNEAVVETEADGTFEAYYNIGTMLAKVEQYSLAKKLLKKAVELDQYNEDAYINYEIVKRLDDNDDNNDGDGESDNGNGQGDNQNDNNNSGGNNNSDSNDNKNDSNDNKDNSDQEGNGGAGSGSGKGDGNGSGNEGNGQGDSSGNGKGGSGEGGNGGGNVGDDSQDNNSDSNSDNNSDKNGNNGGNGGGESENDNSNSDNNSGGGSGGNGEGQGNSGSSGNSSDSSDDKNNSENNQDNNQNDNQDKSDSNDNKDSSNGGSSDNQSDKNDSNSDSDSNDNKNGGSGNGGDDNNDQSKDDNKDKGGSGGSDNKNDGKNGNSGSSGQNNDDNQQNEGNNGQNDKSGNSGTDNKDNNGKNSDDNSPNGGNSGSDGNGKDEKDKSGNGGGSDKEQSENGDSDKDSNGGGSGNSGSDDNENKGDNGSDTENGGGKEGKDGGSSDSGKDGKDKGSDEKDDKSSNKEDKSDAEDSNDGKKDNDGEDGDNDSEKEEDPQKKNARDELKRFPDDPSILLKNKMLHQYREQRYGKDVYEKNPW